MPFRGLRSQHERGFFGSRMGPLQHQLQKGEYGLFKHSPVFESDFIQISKKGGPIEIHNQEQIVTVGITTSNPLLLIPDVLLVARPVHPAEGAPLLHGGWLHPGCQLKYELSRLFPLCLVKISVHNAARQQLRFKLANGRTFHLQLCPELHKREELFETWTRIIHLLWPPSETGFKRKEFDRIRNSPPLRATAPSPKPTAESMTSWSDLPIAKSLLKDKGKRKARKAKSPMEDPAPPPRAEEEAELISPLPSQTWEMTDAFGELLAEGSPSCESQTVEEWRPESSPSPRRRSIKESHSSRSTSRKRGATRKPSRLLSLIRSCSWGDPRQKRHVVRSWSKGKRWSAR
ncbi:Golgi-associated RAB2B interactor protein 3-like isoform X2 [Paroedura picta]|uniref:Golgi-associated RAB2B interactor protein 3-like isoform X2 n=1 Tax=Paroedura picta TaxID=143630 RepID=UPI0040567AAB